MKFQATPLSSPVMTHQGCVCPQSRERAELGSREALKTDTRERERALRAQVERQARPPLTPLELCDLRKDALKATLGDRVELHHALLKRLTLHNALLCVRDHQLLVFFYHLKR